MVPVGWSVSRIAMVVVMSGSLRWDGMGGCWKGLA